MNTEFFDFEISLIMEKIFVVSIIFETSLLFDTLNHSRACQFQW